MKKFNIWYRMRTDHIREQVIEASSERSAIKVIEKMMCNHLGIKSNDIVDEEIYCEEVK